MQPLNHLEVVAGDLILPAVLDEVGVLPEVLRDRTEAEATAGRDELLLDLHATAHEVHGAVVVHPLVDGTPAEDLISSVADAHLGDFGYEAVHPLHSAAVGGDHFEVDLPDGFVDAGERVLEIEVLPT